MAALNATPVFQSLTADERLDAVLTDVAEYMHLEASKARQRMDFAVAELADGLAFALKDALKSAPAPLVTAEGMTKER